MTAAKKAGPVAPGKKKGGAMFPRIGLQSAVGYARKLVSKTHTGPQPASIILPGVFGAGSSRGEVRASALKQFGLLQGKKDAYDATPLAKAIAAAPEGETRDLYSQAARSPKVFSTLFNTFHGDTVSLAKLKQQAAQADVHPDETESCARLFVESMVFAGLASSSGDDAITLSSNVGQVGGAVPPVPPEESQEDDPTTEEDDPPVAPAAPTPPPHGGRAVIHVNVTLDSTLDTDKLERQLALLRRYGAL
jgi:hypothetical protein